MFRGHLIATKDNAWLNSPNFDTTQIFCMKIGYWATSGATVRVEMGKDGLILFEGTKSDGLHWSPRITVISSDTISYINLYADRGAGYARVLTTNGTCV